MRGRRRLSKQMRGGQRLGGGWGEGEEVENSAITRKMDR